MSVHKEVSNKRNEFCTIVCLNSYTNTITNDTEFSKQNTQKTLH